MEDDLHIIKCRWCGYFALKSDPAKWFGVGIYHMITEAVKRGGAQVFEEWVETCPECHRCKKCQGNCDDVREGGC